MRQDSKDKALWYADDGKFFRRISDKLIVGNRVRLEKVTYINNVRLPLPHLETIDEYEEIDDSVLEKEAEEARRHTLEKYPLYVEEGIREKYTVSDELAILRQRDTKPEKFEEYFAFCEAVKTKAKKDLGIE